MWNIYYVLTNPISSSFQAIGNLAMNPAFINLIWQSRGLFGSLLALSKGRRSRQLPSSSSSAESADPGAASSTGADANRRIALRSKTPAANTSYPAAPRTRLRSKGPNDRSRSLTPWQDFTAEERAALSADEARKWAELTPAQRARERERQIEQKQSKSRRNSRSTNSSKTKSKIKSKVKIASCE